VGAVEGALKAALGVVGAQVALLTEQAQVEFDPLVTDEATIADAVEAVGFGAEVTTAMKCPCSGSR
jgi:copper chaperone CopZ